MRSVRRRMDHWAVVSTTLGPPLAGSVTYITWDIYTNVDSTGRKSTTAAVMQVAFKCYFKKYIIVLTWFKWSLDGLGLLGMTNFSMVFASAVVSCRYSFNVPWIQVEPRRDCLLTSFFIRLGVYILSHYIIHDCCLNKCLESIYDGKRHVVYGYTFVVPGQKCV